METAIRKEILPQVSLTSITTKKFKTGCISVTFKLQLESENAAKNALLPQVLLRGCARYPDMESLSAAMDELYGARIEPVVRKKGEVQCVGLYADFVDDAFVPKGEKLLEKVAELIGQILLFPATKAGIFNSDYVKSERENLSDRIRARINDKQLYAATRLNELMCSGEAYSVDSLGNADDSMKITPQTLTEHYRRILEGAAIEIFYCGSADRKRIETAMLGALGTLPRTQNGFAVASTDVKTETGDVRYFKDSLDVTQGKLALGFRLGEIMRRPALAPIMVFNAVYGGSVTSKLFTNVRERLSLCYYASSRIERHKGLLFVYSGIEVDKYDDALKEILHQMELCRQGQITADELSNAKKSVVTDLNSLMDDQTQLENYYLGQALDSTSCTPDLLASLVSEVSAEEVVAVANSVRLDSVYFIENAERSA